MTMCAVMACSYEAEERATLEGVQMAMMHEAGSFVGLTNAANMLGTGAAPQGPGALALVPAFEELQAVARVLEKEQDWERAVTVRGEVILFLSSVCGKERASAPRLSLSLLHHTAFPATNFPAIFKPCFCILTLQEEFVTVAVVPLLERLVQLVSN
jgi:hypothetical protein